MGKDCIAMNIAVKALYVPIPRGAWTRGSQQNMM